VHTRCCSGIRTEIFAKLVLTIATLDCDIELMKQHRIHYTMAYAVLILPQVPYNTLIDYFIMVSTLALAVTAFLAVLPNFITDVEQSKQANVALAVISLVLVNVGLCAWLIAAYMVAHKPKKTAPVVYVEGRNW
jgi:uncharacterized protein with PQ loop repeat